MYVSEIKFTFKAFKLDLHFTCCARALKCQTELNSSPRTPDVPKIIVNLQTGKVAFSENNTADFVGIWVGYKPGSKWCHSYRKQFSMCLTLKAFFRTFLPNKQARLIPVWDYVKGFGYEAHVRLSDIPC